MPKSSEAFGMRFGGWSAACLLLLTCLGIGSQAQTFRTLVTLNGTDGSAPFSTMVQGRDGNLYGTMANGGANGHGSVFKVTPSGTLTTIYSFCVDTSCVDGSIPEGALALGSDGNFYGTTMFGGTGTAFCGSGCGTVFRVTPAGALTTLYSFCIQTSCLDGYTPDAGLVQGIDGNFYGTTPNGGGPFLQGTVFKITPTGTLTTLYAFCVQTSCADGQTPLAALIQGADGDFYGSTSHGGANFFGEIFKITATGTFSIVHSFDLTDGQDPTTRLLQAANGTFYGMTQAGGTSTACSGSSCGTIFKMTTAGTLTTFLSFDDTDGAFPEYNGMVQASDGNFYGTTAGGGTNADGTIFKLTPAGALTTLYNFCSLANCADGAGVSSIMQATNGTFYGTTAGGGSLSEGTLFSLSAGLHRVVAPVPTSGRVGAHIAILGNGLTGTTGVSFNGTAATFTVVSSTNISAIVPTGATTGKITVATPGGTLTSTAVFRVK